MTGWLPMGVGGAGQPAANGAVYHLAAGDTLPWQVYGPEDQPVDVRVGWDAARATFFAQVSKDAVATDGDGVVSNAVRVGASPYEVDTARQALDAVRPWAVVPDWLDAELERAAGPRRDRVATVHDTNDDEYLGAAAIATFLDGSDDDAVIYRILPPLPGPGGEDPSAPAAAAAFAPLLQVSTGDPAHVGPDPAPPSALHRGPRR